MTSLRPAWRAGSVVPPSPIPSTLGLRSTYLSGRRGPNNRKTSSPATLSTPSAAVGLRVPRACWSHARFRLANDQRPFGPLRPPSAHYGPLALRCTPATNPALRYRSGRGSSAYVSRPLAALPRPMPPATARASMPSRPRSGRRPGRSARLKRWAHTKTCPAPGPRSGLILPLARRASLPPRWSFCSRPCSRPRHIHHAANRYRSAAINRLAYGVHHPPVSLLAP